MITYLDYRSTSTAGFSAMELLATVGLVGILGSLSIAVALRHHDSVAETRLQSDVDSLNRAIASYETNGGLMPTDSTVPQVLSKLKSVGDDVAQRSFPGFAGSFLDGRFVARQVVPGEGGARAVWDPLTKRIEIAEAGIGFRFEREDQPTAEAGQVEARRRNTPGFAQASPWIWDYQDRDRVTAMPSMKITIEDADPLFSPSYLQPVQLAPPGFSVPGGVYPRDAFPLELALVNPPSNPAQTPIRYSLDSSDWMTYDGSPISIEPETHVVAYADAPDQRQYFSSFASTQFYDEEAKTLLFAGQSSGDFRDAEGEENMVVDYLDQGFDATFEWGEGTGGYDTGSILSFTSEVFVDVAAETWFRLGGLHYYNSTISLATQATKVWFDIAIDFATPKIQETFAFELALENTRNRRRQTADENADFVRITNPSSAFSTSLNGQAYELQLQFGYLGSDGFATVDQFHVHEGAEAEADIWGFFSPILDEAQP